jgi:hypothetical protein
MVILGRIKTVRMIQDKKRPRVPKAPGEASPQTMDHGSRIKDQRTIEELDFFTTNYALQGL